MVFATIALPLVSPLVAEAIVAAFAAVAGLMEPGTLPGGKACSAEQVLEVLEDNAKLVDNLSPYLFSALCRADAATASGHSDASTRRTQAALSGACVWILAAICRAVGYGRMNADALWEWANGDALWVAVLVKGILTLDELVLVAPDTPLKGALIPADLAQLQDVAAGAFFGLIGSSVAFADAVAVLKTNEVIDEVSAPNITFAKHWAKLAVAVSESGLVVHLLKTVEGPASGRRAQLAGFFAKILQGELLKDPYWIGAFSNAPIIVEAARMAAASIRATLGLHNNRLWALLATVPSTGRTPRSFPKDCSELAFRSPAAVAECASLVRGCLSDSSTVMDPGSLTALCVFAANVGMGPTADTDGGLSATLLSLQPDARNLVASRLAEWTGPVTQNAQVCWLQFLQGSQPLVSSWDDTGMAPAMALGPEHCRSLGMGGLKELMNAAPVELSCSLDRQLLTNPMRSPYGHAFEYSVLTSALAQNGQLCPMTGQPLSIESCQNDWGLKKQADNHIGHWAQEQAKAKK